MNVVLTEEVKIKKSLASQALPASGGRGDLFAQEKGETRRPPLENFVLAQRF